MQVGDRAGVEFPVDVPTHVSAIARFAGGGISQSLFSFQSPLATTGYVEITGTEGTLIIPDPNKFTGEVMITRAPGFAEMNDPPKWESVPSPAHLPAAVPACWTWRARSVPVARRWRPGELGYHVLDTLISIEEAIETGQTVDVASTVDAIPPIARNGIPSSATL